MNGQKLKRQRMWQGKQSSSLREAPTLPVKIGALRKIGAEYTPLIQKTVANKGVLKYMKLGIVGLRPNFTP